jgi:hypothetical protein
MVGRRTQHLGAGVPSGLGEERDIDVLGETACLGVNDTVAEDMHDPRPG